MRDVALDALPQGFPAIDRSASDTLGKRARPMSGNDIAATMLWIAELPPHLNINRLELMPVSQPFTGFQVTRES